MATAMDAREWARQGSAASVTRCTRRSEGKTETTSTEPPTAPWCDTASQIWVTKYSGAPAVWAEFWALTLDERKRLLEVAIEEARAGNPDVVIQACTSTTAAKDCLDLTRHAQDAGADIVYIQTPVMETHGREGVLRLEQEKTP